MKNTTNKSKRGKPIVGPLLSKKKKKKLEKIIERKFKKSNRAHLLEELSKLKTLPGELDCLTSLQSAQTLGRKKFMQNDFYNLPNNHHKTNDSNDKSRNKDNFNKLNKRPGKFKPPFSKRRRLLDRDNIVDTSSSSEEDGDESQDLEEKITDPITENQKIAPIVPEDKDAIQISITEPISVDKNGEILETTADENIKQMATTEPITEDGKIAPIVPEDKEVIQISVNNNGEILATTTIVNEDQEDIEIIQPAINTEPDKNNSPTITPAVYKILNRLPKVNEDRSKLPVVLMEYEIMTAIKENSIIIIDGSTGSGKTTQVPQFLYEAGFTNDNKIIGVTEPRRVAAIEMSKRVAYEMNLSQDEVSFQIRFEGNTTEKTRIKFLTDGVLLKEFLDDPLLEKYSSIIIDEAHERSVFSDIMIGILSRVVKCRDKKEMPLKVVIMSATMDEASFTSNPKLFANPPPVVKVQSRMFDVVVHYNKITNPDYLEEAYKKACKVHRKLPAGGILIFVTGKEEVLKLCQKLRGTFPKPKKIDPNKLCSYERKVKATKERWKGNKSDTPVDNDKINEPFNEDDNEREVEQALHVLPMFSMLNSNKLNMVFDEPPLGTRLCVVATNIAETTLTIPNIVYVIDTGKIKGKVYYSTTGISKMKVMWTSKASADQRKGRAGRVQNGHCYRLYSSAVFTDIFAKHAPADILRRPVDDVVLAMKSRKVPVMTFPYITSPPEEELRRSIKRLKLLGALSESQQIDGKDLSKITPYGKKMCQLAVSPRYSKMLIESFDYLELVPYFILLVCGLTVPEFVLEAPVRAKCKSKPPSDIEGPENRISWLGEGMSRYLGDLMILMGGMLKAEEAIDAKKFCEDNGLRYKAYQEIRKLRRQITNHVNIIFPELNAPLFPQNKELSNAEANMMRKIILQGSLDRIAKKVLNYEIKDDDMRKRYHDSYRIINSQEPVFLHHSSPFKQELPKWIVYQDIFELNGKIILRGVSTIEPQWVTKYCPEMSLFSDPLPTTTN